MTAPLRPPRLAAWLLERLAPADWTEHFRGDLDEEFALMARDRPRAAARWYWRQVFRAAGAGIGARQSRSETPRRGTRMQAILMDLRQAGRVLRRQSRYAALVVGILGLSLGTGAAALGVVSAYLWTPLPYPNADRIVSIEWVVPDVPIPPGLFTLDWTDLPDLADLTVSWDIDGFTIIGGPRPAAVDGRWIRPDVFPMFGITPVLGRTFSDLDADRYEPVAMISRRLWHRQFDGDPAVLGQPITVRSADRPDEVETFTIVGVLPDRFWHLDDRTDLLLPLRGSRTPSLMTLREGVSPERASERLTSSALGQLSAADPRWRVEVTPALAQHVEPVRDLLRTIAGAVTLLVLVTFANLTFLQVARGMTRHREMAVRGALGASTARLVRQVIVEQAVLGVAASVVAVGCAAALLGSALPAIEQYLGRLAQGAANGHGFAILTPGVIAATIGTAIAACVGSGLLPALRLSAGRLAAAVAGSVSTTDPAGRLQLRYAIVLAQVAGSFALLACAGLMVQSARQLAAADIGLDPANVLSANLTLHERSYPDVADRRRLVAGVVSRIEAIAGVESAGMIAGWPYAAYPGQPIAEPGGPSGDAPPAAARYAVNPSYFNAVGLELIDGRLLDASDATAPGTNVVISAALARRLWPGRPAVGRTFSFAPAEDAGMHAEVATTLSVVGIVNDVSRSLVEQTAPEVYVPLERAPGHFLFLQVRTTGDRPDLIPAIERAVLAEDPNLPLATVEPLENRVYRAGVRPSFLAGVLTAFSALTAVVALIGIYAISAWMARQRRREAAVRVALGATSDGVVRLFVARGAMLVAIGLAAGWIMSQWLGGLLEAELVGVEASDVGIRLAVAAGLGLVSVVAVWLPIRRVSGEDPAGVLREP